MRCLHFCGKILHFFDYPIEAQFPAATVLLLELDRLYESLLSLPKLTSISQCSRITIRAVGLYESFRRPRTFGLPREGSREKAKKELEARSKLSTLVTAGVTRKAFLYIAHI